LRRLFAKEMTDWGIDKLFSLVVLNVSAHGTPYPLVKGPRGGRSRERGMLTNAGILPVPIVWGQLRRSIKQVRFNSVFGVVYSDSKTAHYNRYVHDGTRKMKKRPFVTSAVKVFQPRFSLEMKRRFKKVQDVGRA